MSSSVTWGRGGEGNERRGLIKWNATQHGRKTRISKVFVEAFDVSVHDFERVQLVLTDRHATHEV